MPRKRGIGNVGRERLRRNWEDIQSGFTTEAPSSAVTGFTPEVNEQIKEAQRQMGETLQAQDVSSLPDLWPDTSNYYQGPTKSTRVSRHKFEFVNTSSFPTLIPSTKGTAYVKFTNLRQRKDGTVYEKEGSGVIYAYYNVPYADYKTFTMSKSKGRMINTWTRQYQYQKLGQDDSIFDS